MRHKLPVSIDIPESQIFTPYSIFYQTPGERIIQSLAAFGTIDKIQHFYTKSYVMQYTMGKDY